MSDFELNLQISANNDDCWGYSPNLLVATVVIGAGRYEIGDDWEGSGLRFSNVTVPGGSIIREAYLVVTGYRYGDEGSVDTCNTRISAEKEDNPRDFTNDNWTSFSARWANRTTARVDWNSIPHFSTGVEYQSPDIKTVIQEIVNRAGWASGNSMVLFWDDFEQRSTPTVRARRFGYPYNVSPSQAAKLNITHNPHGYKLDAKGLYIPYEDLNGEKKLHVLLKNLSPTSKAAGEGGEVVIEVTYEPAA